MLAKLREYGINAKLFTNWGGRSYKGHLAEIDRLGISEYVVLGGYIPHWEIPDAIRNCHIGLFMENNFQIKFHTPGIPYEYWCCGRPIITTREIANKAHIQPNLSENKNAFVVDSSPLNIEECVKAVVDARASLIEGGDDSPPIDASLSALNAKKHLTEFLEKIME